LTSTLGQPWSIGELLTDADFGRLYLAYDGDPSDPWLEELAGA
jgi:hypothetical protein